VTGSRWRRLAQRLRERVGRSQTAPARQSSPNVGRILRSGLFDRAYYEIQCGRAFDTDGEAVQDFLQQGHRLGFSPHPLFEPEWYLAGRPRNRPNSLVLYLSEGGGEHGPGPLFDEAGYLHRVPQAHTHPGGALGHFVAQVSSDDPLPVPTAHRASSLSWGQARALAYESAREFRHYEDLRSTRRRGPWDEAADRRFVADWLARSHRTDETRTPAVSVVMPVRNRPVQVLEAIASVQDQTLPDWELIVVDDGSSDDTAEVVARAAAADPRVRLVRRPPSGVSAARNAGIAAATGEWLAFLDSDNTWVPHFLQVMLGYLRSRGLRAGHAVIDTMTEPTDEHSGRYLAFSGGLEHLLVRNHIDLNGLMVQTGLAVEVGGFDESLRRWVDHDLAIRIAQVTDVPLVPFVGVRYDHQLDSTDRITTTESDHWEWVVLGKHHNDWDKVQKSAHERRAGLVSICMPSLEDWAYTRVAIDAVLDAADRDPDAAEIELILLINGARRCVGTVLRSLYDDDPRVRILSVPRNLNFSVSANLAFSESTGQTVVFLDNDTEVLDGWLPPLLREIEDPEVLGCQALLLNPDGSVQTAGWAFIGAAALPSPLLANHPVEDAVRAAPISMRAVAASALAMRAEDVIRLRGFGTSFVNGCEDLDLCLRAVDGGPQRFRVATDSLVVHRQRRRLPLHYDRDQANRRHWLARWGATPPPSDLGVLEQLGYRVAHLDSGEAVEAPRDVRMPVPVVIRPETTVVSGPAAGEPSLRWALKTAVPLRSTEPTVDLELAAGLAAALRRLGQEVVTDRLEAGQRASGYLDDVAVVLRRDQMLPEEPGRINIAWILDPAVTLETAEARRYDAVLSISSTGPALHPGAAWTAGGRRGDAPTPVPDADHLDAAARMLLSRAVDLRHPTRS
jgi:glycosyltransferase involved in cell wall biosynthesis